MSVVIDERLGRSEVPTFSPEMITHLERAQIPDSFNVDDLTAIRPLARTVDDMWKDPHYAQLYTDQEWFQRYTQQDSFQDLRDLPDFPEMAQGMLNRAFLSDLWGDSLDDIDDTYDARRDVFAQELLGRPAKSEADLAQGIAAGFSDTALELGARIVRGGAVGVQQTRAGFYAVLESLLRGQRNPYIDKTTAEAQADVVTLQARVAELEAKQDERRRGEFNTFSGIASPELSQLRRQLEMAQLAAQGQVSENFLGSLSRASDDLADESREDQARAGTLFADTIVPAHDDWWMMRVADSLGQSAAGTATTMLNPVLGLSLIYAQTYEGSLAEYQAVAQERGLDTSIEAAERYAHGQALIQTPFELVGDVKIGKAIKGAFGSIPRKILSSGPEPYGHWIAERTKEITKSLAGEVLITTPAQTIGESLLAENAGVRDETSWQDKGWATLDAMSIAIGQAGAMTGGSLAISGGIKVAKGDFAQANTVGKQRSFQPEETHKGFIDLDAHPTEAYGVRFSKGTVTPSDIGRMWLEIAKDDRTEILGPTPKSKDLSEILHALSPGVSTKIDIVSDAGRHGPGYTFLDGPEHQIYLIKETDRSFHVDSSEAGLNSTPIYQAIYTWAHNNGFQINEDNTMTPEGVYRRTSHMFSNALRTKTTQHMTVGPHSGIEGQWIRYANTPEKIEHNIGLLAIREAELVTQLLPELTGIRYDKSTQSFHDGEYRIPDKETYSYLKQRIAGVDPEFSRRVGIATLRRALATLAGNSTGPDGLGRLVGENAETVQPLHRSRYSKNEADTGGGHSDSRERPPASGGEPAPVSGGIGPEGNSKSLVSNPPTVSRVEQILDGIQSRWGSRLKTKIHASVREISDAGLRDDALKAGNVEAFFNPNDGTIHVIADRVTSVADAERLLRHEGIHWALTGPLKKQYAAIREQAGRRIPWDEMQKLIAKYPEGNVDLWIEEYLAYQGQTNPQSTVWRQFVLEVKTFLKNRGINIEFTDADILAFLQKANRRMERAREADQRHFSPNHQGHSFYSKGSDPILDTERPLRHDQVTKLFRENPNHPSAQALKAWFGPSFRDLQDGKLPEQEALLNDLLSRLPVYSTRKPIFRGVRFDNERLRDAFLAEFDGPTWPNKNRFMSASENSRTAMTMAASSQYPVFITIEKNKTGREIGPLGFLSKQFGWQEEILYKRGANYKILDKRKIDFNGKEAYSIRLEEIQ